VPPSLFLSFCVFCTSASAQEGRSRPIGYLDQAIPTGQTRSFSVPFDPESSSLPQTVGRLTAVGTNYLENSAAAWTPGAFSTAAAPYFARITSGAHAGRMFRIVTPANTATRLYVADDGVGLATLGSGNRHHQPPAPPSKSSPAIPSRPSSARPPPATPSSSTAPAIRSPPISSKSGAAPRG
jgi:hypothetical protein